MSAPAAPAPGAPRASAPGRRGVHLVDLTSIAGATYSPTLGYL